MCLWACESCLYDSICLHFWASWMILAAVSPSSSPEHRNTVCNMGGRKIKWCRSNSLVLQVLSMNITSNININSVDSQMRSQICCLIKGPDQTFVYAHLHSWESRLHSSSIFLIIDLGLLPVVRNDQNCQMYVFVWLFFFASLYVAFSSLKKCFNLRN